MERGIKREKGLNKEKVCKRVRELELERRRETALCKRDTKAR